MDILVTEPQQWIEIPYWYPSQIDSAGQEASICWWEINSEGEVQPWLKYPQAGLQGEWGREIMWLSKALQIEWQSTSICFVHSWKKGL